MTHEVKFIQDMDKRVLIEVDGKQLAFGKRGNAKKYTARKQFQSV